MSDPVVARWEKRGQIAMWTLNRPPDWNIGMDAIACDSLHALLDLWRRARWSSKTRIALDRPTVTANGRRGEAGFRLANELVLCHNQRDVQPETWDLSAASGSVTLVVGDAMIEELDRAILDVKAGNGDYSIGVPGGRLWVWWYVDEAPRGR